MATHRPTPSTPPDLPEGSGADLPLDHALSLLLADETENALRWGAAVLESGPWTPSALVVTARLLNQMGRRRAATEGLKLAIQQAITAGNLPLAMAAIGDLRSLGADVEDLIKGLAATFCKGSDRLRDSQSPPLLPQLGEFQPLSPFLTGPALASKAAQILESVRETRTEQPEPAAARVAPLPLFSSLAEEPLHDLLAAFETLTVPAGHVVIREGEEEAAAYIVARGELEVSRRSADDGKSLVLARLGSGAFFGEMAILSQLPGAASVVATRPTILLVAKRAALEAVVEKHPEVANELAAHCRRQAVANLGWASPVVVSIPPAERSAMVERFETRMFESGDKLVETGEEAGGLHLVVSGEVAVVAYEGGERVVLATLTPGETVGEVELVLCRSSAADAIAVRPTATLFLPRTQFFSLVQEHPAILHGLYAMAVRRHAETKLALETGASQMADEAMLDDMPKNVAALVEDVTSPTGATFDSNGQRITPLARGTMSLPRVTTPPRGTPLPAPPTGGQARRSLPPPPLPPPAPMAAPPASRMTTPPPLPRTTLPMGAPPPVAAPLQNPSVAPTAAAVMQKVQASRDESPKLGLVAALCVAAVVIGFLVMRSGQGPEQPGAAATLAPPPGAAAVAPARAETTTAIPVAAATQAPVAPPAAAPPAAAPLPQAFAPRPHVAAAPKPVVVVEPTPSPAPPVNNAAARANEAPAQPPAPRAEPAPRPVAPPMLAPVLAPAAKPAAQTAGEFGGRE